MSIETLLSDMTAALNKNTETLLALKGAAAASSGTADKTTRKTTEKKEEAPKITQEMVNAALVKLKDEFGADNAKSVIKEHGKCDKMSKIKPANFQAVYDAACALYDELKAGGSGGSSEDL